jgi:hypothetical protein
MYLFGPVPDGLRREPESSLLCLSKRQAMVTSGVAAQHVLLVLETFSRRDLNSDRNRRKPGL